MPFTPLRDPVTPSRDLDILSCLVVRAMSWVMARLVEGFASCAIGMYPELMWFTNEHSDQTSAPFSGTMYRLSLQDVAPSDLAVGVSTSPAPTLRSARQ
jgi:hypothetical protein